MSAQQESTQQDLSGGALVVTFHLKKYLGLIATPDRAEALWQELRAWLLKSRLRASVHEIEGISAQATGSLDTLIRGDLLDALAMVLTDGQFRWPLNATRPAQLAAFDAALDAGVAKRSQARQAQQTEQVAQEDATPKASSN